MNQGQQQPALTAEQRRIVSSTALAVEVSAYAGTGKTTTLCQRVAELLRRQAQPSEILVLTFSKSAVATLKEWLPEGVVAQTLHSFALEQVIRAKRAVGERMPRLLTPKQELAYVARALKEQAKGSKKSQAESSKRMNTAATNKADLAFVAEFFALVAAGGGDLQAVANEEGSDFGQLLPYLKFLRKSYERLQKLKRDKGVLTYSDMISLGCGAIGRRDHQLGVKHLLVDEYQDSTPSQALLIKALVARVNTVMVFGDQMQSIYGFAGAKYTSLKKLLPTRNVKSYPLTRSHRLTDNNARLATAVIRQRNSHAAALIGTRGRGARPRLIQCAEASMQSAAVVQLVKGLTGNGTKARNIAILARTEAQLREVEQALLAVDQETMPLYRSRSRKTLLKVIGLLSKLERLDGEDDQNKRLDKLLGRISVKRKVPETTLGNCRRKLKQALESSSLETRYRTCSAVYMTMHGARKLGPDTQDELNRWGARCREFNCAEDFRQHVVETKHDSKVRTSTIHRAKGLEWDHVVVLNVVEGSLPFFYSVTPRAIGEELNLFYVAITRAIKSVHLIAAPYVNSRARRIFNKPSPYVSAAQRTVQFNITQYQRDL